MGSPHIVVAYSWRVDVQQSNSYVNIAANRGSKGMMHDKTSSNVVSQ